jgi:hypothetical protein
MKLTPGDCFVVRGKTNLSYLIRVFGKFWSTDGECTYNHAGIIVDSLGKTFESLKRIGYADIDQYKGCNILIVRHKKMTPQKVQKGLNVVEKLNGTIYPWWRLGLHLFHLARFFNRSGIPVCSELVGMFENACGLRETYWGLSPDNLADEWKISKYYKIVYDGVWK